MSSSQSGCTEGGRGGFGAGLLLLCLHCDCLSWCGWPLSRRYLDGVEHDDHRGGMSQWGEGNPTMALTHAQVLGSASGPPQGDSARWSPGDIWRGLGTHYTIFVGAGGSLPLLVFSIPCGPGCWTGGLKWAQTGTRAHLSLVGREVHQH